MVKDENFSSDYFVEKVSYFINEPEELQAMSQALAATDKLPAAQLIYQKIAPYLSAKDNGGNEQSK